MSKQHNTYTEEFKQDAVRLVETSGKPKTQIARDLGVSESALYRWLQTYGSALATTRPNGQDSSELEAEVRQLQRENDGLRQERDILKEAISIFCQHRFEVSTNHWDRMSPERRTAGPPATGAT